MPKSKRQAICRGSDQELNDKLDKNLQKVLLGGEIMGESIKC